MEQPTARAQQCYETAQHAIAMLKSAVYGLLLDAGPEGLRNVDIGKSLGIHAGHARHTGHIPRVLLAIMEGEGVVVQDGKLWSLATHFPQTDK